MGIGGAVIGTGGATIVGAAILVCGLEDGIAGGGTTLLGVALLLDATL